MYLEYKPQDQVTMADMYSNQSRFAKKLTGEVYMYDPKFINVQKSLEIRGTNSWDVSLNKTI
jgi:hypothetical protein